MSIELGLIVSLFVLNVLSWVFFWRFCTLMWESIKSLKKVRAKNFNVTLPPPDYFLRLKINGVQYETNFISFFRWALKNYFAEHPEKAVKEKTK